MSSSNILGARRECFLLVKSEKADCREEESRVRQYVSVLGVLTAALVMHNNTLRPTGRRDGTVEERHLNTSAVNAVTSSLISDDDASLSSLSASISSASPVVEGDSPPSVTN